ncbi:MULTISPECIES: type II toxin-antitoxin system Phd/YefM family antitoxin [Coprobacillaceae]|uniref:type II toxin-antitoxin system Phd/YefM family antitoxin n=1 Tax=Coprobacillaceae TaxID=2810280 RepID=UPI000E4A2EA3|nr:MULTISPECIES: type II toxin-antitoxin system Phd/YefM family antitoxin [Coprobacillaceae]RHM62905.1 prevent-host-death protein [Coprobacillus sp. AF33-1AC]RHS94954.1 prevent-host-death protein [Erysipelatoclostridium sp. AM42-17]
MLAINYSTLRSSMKKYFDIITDSIETIVVTRKNGNNIVMMSEETYNNLIENSYLTQNKKNYDWLMESKSQLESGKTIDKDIKDLEL